VAFVGTGELAESRVEAEWRRRINHRTTKISTPEIMLEENYFASFHNNKINEANAQRTSESSTTSSSTHNFRGYLSRPFLSCNSDRLHFLHKQKNTVVSSFP
jgi:hypothetical protein